MRKEDVSGPYTATCFPAAVDLVSNNHSLDASVYCEYEDAWDEQYYNGPSAKRTRTAIKQVLESAGGSSYKGISEKRSKTEEHTEQILDNAREGGRRVLVYTEIGHIVALRPVSRGWRMLGTHTPVESDEVLTSREIHSFLAQAPSNIRCKGKPCSNIITLNPEKNNGHI